MPDGIDYFIEFSARNKRSAAAPDSRVLQLRTSSFSMSSDPQFLPFLTLVVDGQMLETTPWDRFKEVYVRD
jgi:hypothetical protein